MSQSNWDTNIMTFSTLFPQGTIRLNTPSLQFGKDKNQKCTSTDPNLGNNGALCMYKNDLTSIDRRCRVGCGYDCENDTLNLCVKPKCPVNNSLIWKSLITNTGKAYITCVAPGDGFPHSQCKINSSVNTLCGQINDDRTCSLISPGGMASGNFVNLKGQTWDSISQSSSDTSGWVQCNYSLVKDAITLKEIGSWINALTNGLNQSVTTTLPTLFSYKLRDMCGIYYANQYFYDDLYSSKINFDPYMDPISFQEYIRANYIEKTFLNFSNLYKDQDKFTKLKKSIQSTLQLPQVISNEDGTFSVFIYTSYKIFNDIATNPNIRSSSLNSILNKFLNESTSTIINKDGVRYTPSNAEIEYNYYGPPYLYYNTINIDNTLPLNQSYLTKFLIASNLPDNTFISNTSFLCDIKKWSPTLFALFITQNPEFNVTLDFANKIKDDTGLFPYSYFKNVCDLKDNWYNDICLTILKDNCGTSYQPAQPFLSFSNNIFLTSINSDCNCYTSNITPLIENPYGNITSMCFNKNCSSNKMKTAFNLTDQLCKTKCDDLWSWMNSTNPASKVRNPDFIDEGKFTSLCGKHYKPYFRRPLNIKVLIIFLIITCLVVSTFYFKKRIKIFSLVLLLFLIGLSFTLSILLNGKSTCQNYKSLCKSGLGNLTIPSQFCDFEYDCECQFDSDCPQNCRCASGLCLPVVGNRKTTIVSQYNVNILGILLGIILCICLPTVLMSFNYDKKLLIGWSLFSVLLISIITGALCSGYKNVYKLLPCNL